MTQPILSREEVLKIVRKTLKENGDRDKLSSARFVELAAAIEAAVLEKVCGEPVAHTTVANLEMMKRHNTGVMYRDVLEGDIPLFALTRSKP